MDTRNFDRWARVVGAETSRRRLIKTLAAGAIGAAAASLGLGDSNAGASSRRRSAGNSCNVNADCASNRCVAESRSRKICQCVSASDCPPPADQCRVAICAAGVCGAAINAGAVCDDGDPCTTGDVCQANGTCLGTPISCAALDQCHDVGTCNPRTGRCSNPVKPNGAVCDDGDPCTQTDICQNGVCVGSNPVVCAALNQCHDVGTCDPGTGVCSNAKKTDGELCQSGGQSGRCRSGDCCVPTTCGAQNVSCGQISDGCSATLDCGSCSSGATCQNGQCACPGGSLLCGGTCERGACCVDTDCADRGECYERACNFRQVGQGYRNVCDYTHVPNCCERDTDCALEPCDVSVHCDVLAHQCVHVSACFGCNVCDPSTGGCTANNCNQCQYCGPGGVCKADDSKTYQGCGNNGICSQGDCVTCIANDQFCEGPTHGDQCCSGKCLPNPDPNGFLGDWVCTCRTLIEYCDNDAQCCQGNCAPDPLGSGKKTCQA